MGQYLLGRDSNFRAVLYINVNFHGSLREIKLTGDLFVTQAPYNSG
jgi:hypothetical protein